MKPPICIAILLLAPVQINAAANLRVCPCRARLLPGKPGADTSFVDNKQTWASSILRREIGRRLRENDKLANQAAIETSVATFMSIVEADLRHWNCEKWRCTVGDVPDGRQPACVERNSTGTIVVNNQTILELRTQHFFCASRKIEDVKLYKPQPGRKCNEASDKPPVQRPTFTGHMRSIECLLDREFDEAIDVPTAVTTGIATAVTTGDTKADSTGSATTPGGTGAKTTQGRPDETTTPGATDVTTTAGASAKSQIAVMVAAIPMIVVVWLPTVASN